MMATKKIYRTIGVVPPSTTEMYQDANGNWWRDGGATWDAEKRAWRTTSWKLVEPQYKVTYDDGKQEIAKVAPEIYVEPPPVEKTEGEEPIEPIEDITPKVVNVEEIPSTWQLENQYVSADNKPEWEEYMTREIVGVIPITAPLPQEREDGGDWLAQRAKRRKIAGIPTVGSLR